MYDDTVCGVCVHLEKALPRLALMFQPLEEHLTGKVGKGILSRRQDFSSFVNVFDHLSIGPLFSFFFSFLSFLGLHPQHMELPRLGVESELQMPAYATAMQDLSCLHDLHHSSWQCRIQNSLSKARD